MAFVCMATVGAAAVMLVVAEALASLLPLLIAALLVFAAARWWDRRRVSSGAKTAPAHPHIVPQLASPRPRTPSPPGGWVTVPMWRDHRGRVHRHPVIDAEVISEVDHHG